VPSPRKYNFKSGQKKYPPILPKWVFYFHSHRSLLYLFQEAGQGKKSFQEAFPVPPRVRYYKLMLFRQKGLFQGLEALYVFNFKVTLRKSSDSYPRERSIFSHSLLLVKGNETILWQGKI